MGMESSLKKFLNKSVGIGLILLLMFCFLSFQYSYDLSHTVSCAFALLDGHILDFYDYCLNHFTEINYTPTTYLIFALWNLPLKLLGLAPELGVGRPDLPLEILFWNKMFLCGVYLASATFIYKTAKALGWEKEDSNVCAILWCLLPISVFVQFSLGLYDIITVFFMVLGVYYFVKDRQWLFVLFFALAITCKTIALLYFFPFLLIEEKRISRLILKLLGCVSIYLLYFVLLRNDEAFLEGVLGWSIVDLIFYSNIWFLNPAIIILIVTFAWAYFRDPMESKQQAFSEGIFFANTVSFAFFGTCLFHPNWILMITPFLIFSLCMHKQKRGYLWVIIILSVAYYTFFANMPGPHSEGLVAQGIWGEKGFDVLQPVFALHSIYKIGSLDITYSIMSAALLVIAIFSHPRFIESDHKVFELKKVKIEFSVICGVGILAFVAPAMLSAIPTGIQSGIIYEAYDDASRESLAYVGETDSQFEQKIFNRVEHWTKIEISSITWNQMYDEEMYCDMLIIDDNSQEILYRIPLELNELTNNTGYCAIEIPEITLTPNSWYVIRFDGNLQEEKLAVTTTDKNDTRVGTGYIEVGGNNTEQTMKMRIWGK